MGYVERPEVSIPYSTIKITLPDLLFQRVVAFQFLIVRLKFLTLAVTGNEIVFQFLIVRLK